MYIKPIVAVAVVLLHVTDTCASARAPPTRRALTAPRSYGEEFFDWTRGGIYTVIIGNVSATLAVTYLVILYMATKDVTSDYAPGERRATWSRVERGR